MRQGAGRWVGWVLGGILALGIGGCGPGDTKLVENPSYKPGGHAGSAAAHGQTAPERAPFEGCSWGELSGAGLKLWTQTCPNQRLVADDARGALVIESVVDGILDRGEVIRVLAIPAGGLNALATQLMAEGAAPAGAQCAFAAAPQVVPTPAGVTRYALEPIGATKTAWDRAVASDQIPETLPCGRYGPAPVGDRYVEVQAAHPDMAIFVELGSEIQIYEPNTIQFDHPAHDQTEHKDAHKDASKKSGAH